MKSLDDVWQEYISHDTLSTKTLKDLIWYIENDDKSETIVMITDILVKESDGILLKKLVPYIAKQLEHEDEYVKELAINSLVGRLKLPEYAEKVLNIAQNNIFYGNAQGSAAASLGMVDKKLL